MRGTRISVFLKTGLFWLVYFILIRVFFLIYNYYLTIQLGFTEAVRTFFNGFKLDLSLTGYILFFMAILIAATLAFKGKWLHYILKIYTLIFVVLFSILAFVDMELYKNWGFRIDSTVLFYLKSPKESLASTQLWLIILLLTYTGAFIWLSIKVYTKYIAQTIQTLKQSKWYYFPVWLLIAGLMIIPIRGGLGIAPINVGAVFFSNDQYANHAAINAPWNFGKSLTELNEVKVPHYYDDSVVQKSMAELFCRKSNKKQQLIKQTKPNVLVIILESFTGKVIGSLGGNADATPNFNRLTHEGIFFNHLYATGDRSDKGIVGVLSGYPAQPTSSIIKYTSKTEKLPQLSKLLKADGYHTAFYYGGEINFANMNSYFVSGAYQNLVTMSNFSSNEITTKWGVHDALVFNRILNDMATQNQPFFNAMFTLSSHDPFDVPHTSQFKGLDWDNRYLNSIHYSDSCLGHFIAEAKKTDWWQNTWVILVADHGSKYMNIRYSSPERFNIPMLWLGGVLQKTDTLISATCSQSDIPLMICNQLGKDFSGFNFSKDVLMGSQHFAYYAFNNGFGFITDTTQLVWDIDGNNFIMNDCTTDKSELLGKSFLQSVLNDFTNK
jgi:phosphoglycerol transferase MdoB-like AlkP superfamily enzyme